MPSPFRRCRQTAPADGHHSLGKTQYRRRDPHLEEELCTQCNHCVAACPHSAIRAKVVPPEAMENAPASLHSLDVKSRDMRGQKYVLQVAPEDCTGCNLCVEVCPAKDRQNPEIKAINMMSRPNMSKKRKSITISSSTCQKSTVANWNVLIFVHRS